MKKNVLLFLVFIVLSLNLKAQEKTSLLEAINIADKQKMLIQKLANEKLFFEENKRTNLAQKTIKNVTLEFELGTEILKDLSPNDEIKYKVAIQELTFRTFKSYLESNSNKSLNEILYMNNLFVKMCDDTFNAFLNHEIKNSNLAKSVKVSGSIRYLIHRLCLYHSMHYYEIRTIYPEEINSIITSINKRLNYLTVSEYNTLEIDDEISKALYYWSNLKKELDGAKKNKAGMSLYNPEELWELSYILSDKLNKIPDMYLSQKK